MFKTSATLLENEAWLLRKHTEKADLTLEGRLHDAKLMKHCYNNKMKWRKKTKKLCPEISHICILGKQWRFWQIRRYYCSYFGKHNNKAAALLKKWQQHHCAATKKGQLLQLWDWNTMFVENFCNNRPYKRLYSISTRADNYQTKEGKHFTSGKHSIGKGTRNNKIWNWYAIILGSVIYSTQHKEPGAIFKEQWVANQGTRSFT